MLVRSINIVTNAGEWWNIAGELMDKTLKVGIHISLNEFLEYFREFTEALKKGYRIQEQ